MTDLVREGERYRSTGTDPCFLLHSSRGRLPTDWVLISYRANAAERWLKPSVSPDVGTGFAENVKVPLTRPVRVRSLKAMGPEQTDHHGETLTKRPDIEAHYLICLPSRVRALRLHVVAAGEFVLQDLAIREVGIFQVFLLLLQHHLVPLLRHPHTLLQLIWSSMQSLRTEGIGPLWRRLWLQEKTSDDYHSWVATYDTLTESDRSAIRHHIDDLNYTPLISVVMPVYNTPEEWLRRAVDSVRRQLYPFWELCIADDASPQPHVKLLLDQYQAEEPRIKVVYREQHSQVSAAANSALTLATGAFVALLDHTDQLVAHALYLIAAELNASPQADLLYSDEDNINEDGRRSEPYFKPDWNPELFSCQNFISHLGVYRTQIVRELGGFREGYAGAQDWDLAMRVIERIPAAHIRHIPHVLYHCRARPASPARAEAQQPDVKETQQRVLVDHFHRNGNEVQVLPSKERCWRIKYPLPVPPPRVSLIIPTRDRFDLLFQCVESIFQKTVYPNFEVCIVDNQSQEAQIREYFAQLKEKRGVTILQYDAPFNYAAMNNFAVRQVQGEIIGFLNNDLEVISPEWLAEMVSHAIRPEVGAVGALLYYPNDTIQHAGVILGLGTVAGHVYRHQRRGYPGQRSRALLVQNMSAVTAACVLLRRSVFAEVGGLDETNLRITFNDVDLCLRLLEKGYRNVWTPYAELYHHESASRGYEDTPEKALRLKQEMVYMQRRWGELLQNDPAYNPNLTLEQGDFSLAFPPRRKKPWRMKSGWCSSKPVVRK